ncbi:non-homologous end-joining DNA ligase [Galbibacter pacificus]|uniref:Non-homologous end-joining DNA ligase n=1 Tax=Galbibacter pacificus TaxID=2996052 RepID=A0ABT6FQ10_9FLAO|nr:non-homologous end-joining DNA ligase [Galbibacter pacificus]MDG3582277.1 non-homologous end-joining DNA ligase [Galbibacter pacificus]MDG3585247.1 non-homologous end-joining DNA ligase [Galbibacter pacificus]
MKIQGVPITHPDKILFPEIGLSKIEMVNYYKRVAKYMIPYLKNRPLTLHRFPDGVNKQGFYQKNAADYFPDFIKTVQIKTEEGENTQIVCNNKKSLVYLANQGTIGFHIWLSRTDKLRKPDKVVFDLDPSKDSFKKLKEGVKIIKAFMAKQGKECNVMTSGKKGIHIWYRIRRTTTFEDLRPKIKQYAEELEKLHPEIFTTAIRKNKRNGKIFIDYLRNFYAQTSVCPYSLRPTKNAGIAMPLSWSELDDIPASDHFNVKNIDKRLKFK